MNIYTLDTGYDGALEIRRDANGDRFVTLASITDLLEISDRTYLTRLFRFVVRKPGGESSLPQKLLTSCMNKIPQSKCGLGRGPALAYLQRHAQDEIADMECPAPSAKALVPSAPIDETLKTQCPVDLYRIGNNEVNAVNGALLYSVLKPKVPFDVWIRRALQNYTLHLEFEEVITDEAVLYMVSLHTANDIAMQEDTPEGRRVRDYFQRCEKKLQTAPDLDSLTKWVGATFQAMWDDSKTFQKEVLARLDRIEGQRSFPTIPLLSNTEGITIREASRQCGLKSRIDAERNLPAALQEDGWIEKRVGSQHWSPTTYAIQNGLMTRAGRVRITPKGLEHLRSVFLQEV